MAREKSKTAVINNGIMLKIKSKYSSLMDFYCRANMSMDKAIFYQAMRGEACHPQVITEIELGYLRAEEISAMTIEDLCKAIGRADVSKLQDDIDILRLIVTKLV